LPKTKPGPEAPPTVLTVFSQCFPHCDYYNYIIFRLYLKDRMW